MNPFKALYNKCNTGTSAEKYANLPGGPRIVDVEPVGLCNFRCTMCPTGLGALGRPSGFMDRKTHAKILELTDFYSSAIRYIGWGEPTMHSLLPEFIAAANEAGRLTHMNTNGSKMTPDLAKSLVKAGLTSIKFSFQGVNKETFWEMRRTDFFDGVIEAVRIMLDARRGHHFPHISASTTTTEETPDEIKEFKEKLEPLANEVYVGKTIFEFIDMASVPQKQRDRLERAASLSTVIKKHPSPCPEIYDKLSVHWDGSVVNCCNDYSGINNLGNVNTDSLEKIWRNPIMEKYRNRVALNDYSLPLCNSCFDYMDLTERKTNESPVG